MASRRIGYTVAGQALLFGCGAAAATAWFAGFYASLVLAALLAAWLAALALLRLLPRRLEQIQPRRIEANEAERAVLHAVLDQTPTPLLAINRDSRLRVLNRAARRVFATDEVVVDPPPELARPANGGEIRLGGRVHRMEIARVEGLGPVRTIIVLSDIEDALRATEARATRELLQVLSHEVMNALTPIASLSESAAEALARPDPPLDPLRDMVETLARRTAGLRHFTQAYRQLARLPEPTREPVRLSEIVDDAERMFVARWGDRVGLEVVPARDGIVPVDRAQLGQALWALLQNAAEAALAGCLTPNVRLSVTSNEGRGVFLVEDNGPGIDAEHAERIFQAFFTTKAEGNGVGLSLARQIARGHGGELTLRPMPEREGAAFELRI